MPLPIANFTRTIKEANLTGIAANSRASGKVTPGGIHHGYMLYCQTSAGVALTRAEMLADISNIRLYVDGELKMDGDVTFFLDNQKYYGDFAGDGNLDGVIPLPWVRRNMASFQERSLYAIGMKNNPKTGKDVSSITVECDIIGVAKLSTIELYVVKEEGERNMGQHITVGRNTQSFASTGDNEVSDIPKGGPTVGVLALHIRKPGSSTITKVTTKVNLTEIDDQVPNNVAKAGLAGRNRIAQAAYYHVDYAKHDDIAGFIPMAGVTDFRQKITWATAAPNAYDIFVERVEGLKTGK